MSIQYRNKTSFLFFIFFALVFIGFSQPKKADDIKEFIWGANDKYKELPSIPNKWNNESAVVILDNQNHYYNKTKKSLDNFFLTRRIIKLNDKASVEKFSEFTYPTFIIDGIKEIKTWMGIKIIKPDGTVKEIDVENEKVKTTSDKSVYYYGFIRKRIKSDEIYKLAIPELEIGDVLDFYIYTYEEYKTSGSYVMDAIETTLSDEYPTMEFVLKLKVENDFFINFNSFNGAPELEDITQPKQRDKEYRLYAKDIEKRESSLQWVYPLVEYPSYKYQIYFAKSGVYEKRTFGFLSEKEDIVKKSVNTEEILDKFDQPFATDLVGKKIKKYFKDKNYSKQELAEKAYYYMRHFYFNQYIEAAIADKERFLPYPFNYYDANSIAITRSGRFFSRYCSFLKRNDIPFEIILTKKRYDGDMDDLLIRGNLEWIIKVNTENPFYAYPVDNNSILNWVPHMVEGNEAYILKYDDKYYKVTDIEKTTLPVSNYLDNNSKEISNVSFSDDFSEIKVNKESYHKGHNKISQIENRLTYLDYLPEERAKFGTAPFADFLGKKARIRYDDLNNAYIEKLTKKRLERLEEDTEDEYDFKIEDYSYKTEKTSRYKLNDEFVFNESYTIKEDLIKRAGPNYIFEIGKMIGSQVAIEENDKARQENIYMPYPRSYDNKIIVTIPDGYTISGYDKLNLKIENETGGFVSSAKLEGNQLVVISHKYYMNNFEPNSNWTKMLEFLEVAYQFSQEKILLKKK